MLTKFKEFFNFRKPSSTRVILALILWGGLTTYINWWISIEGIGHFVVDMLSFIGILSILYWIVLLLTADSSYENK